jgi:hypothetical protein
MACVQGLCRLKLGLGDAPTADGSRLTLVIKGMYRAQCCTMLASVGTVLALCDRRG